MPRAMCRMRQRRSPWSCPRRSSFDVVAGEWVVDHAVVGDEPERAVGLAVTAAVEAVSAGFPAGRFDGGGAAESGERGVVADPARVVAGDQQEAGGDLGADPGLLEEAWRGAGDELVERAVELGDLLVENLVASSERPQRRAGRADGVEPVGAAHSGATIDQLAVGQSTQQLAQLVRGGHHEVLEVGDRLRSGLHRAGPSVAQYPDRFDDPVPALRIAVASPERTLRAAASASRVSFLPR